VAGFAATFLARYRARDLDTIAASG
jgi:hypothetical protein